MSENLPKVDINFLQSDDSENYLRNTLLKTKFLINKLDKDYGIDFYVELIDENLNNTGCKFNIQLKSCRNKSLNSDGSLSYPLNTSNINYLKNKNDLSYYVLFDVDRNRLLFKSLQDVFNDINKEQLIQDTITLRFEKLLNEENQNIIYNDVLNFHKKMSSVNDVILHNSYNGNLVGIQDKFINPNEFIHYLENLTLTELQNNCDFSKIIEESENIPLSIIKNSKYYLVLSICGYYLERIPFAKSCIALINIDELKGIDKSFYYLFDFFLNDNSEDLTINGIEEIKDNIGEELAIYVDYEILSNKVTNLNPLDFNEDIFSDLMNSVKTIRKKLSVEKKDVYMILKFHLLSIILEEKRVNYFLVKKRNEIDLIKDSFHDLYEKYSYFMSLTGNKELMLEEIYSSAVINFSNFIIETFKYFKLLKLNIGNEKVILEDIEKKLEESYMFNKHNGMINNLIIVSRTKILLYKYKRDFAKLRIEETNLKNILDNIKGADKKTKSIVNDVLEGNTFFDVLDYLDEYSNIIDEFNKEVLGMNLIDIEREKRLNRNENPFFMVEIFPFGFFKIEKDRKDLFFDVLDLKVKLRENIVSLWEKGISVCLNSYVVPIIQEGRLNGKLEMKDFENIECSFKVRKLLFDNNFNYFLIN